MGRVEPMRSPFSVHSRKASELSLLALLFPSLHLSPKEVDLDRPRSSFECREAKRNHRDHERPYRYEVAYVHRVWAGIGPRRLSVFNRGAEI